MAQVLTAPPSIATYTHTDIDEAIEVQIHPKTNRITVLFETNAGLIAFSGIEGGQLTADLAFPITAGSAFTIRVDSGPDRVSNLRLYTEVGVQPTIVKIISESD